MSHSPMNPYIHEASSTNTATGYYAEDRGDPDFFIEASVTQINFDDLNLLSIGCVMDEVPDPIVINELRALFKAGATPSRLMRHIIANHEPKILPWTDKLIRAYFREAFRIPMFRLSAGLLADGPEGLVVAHINRNVIHQMIVNRSEWDKESADAPPISTWMDSLAATDESQMVEKSHPELWQELSGIWDKLDDSARKCIRRLMGNFQTQNEKVEILATLSEQLQQQVITLENEINSSVGAKTK